MKKIAQGQKTAMENCYFCMYMIEIPIKFKTKSDNLYQQDNLEMVIKLITIIFLSHWRATHNSMVY